MNFDEIFIILIYISSTVFLCSIGVLLLAVGFVIIIEEWQTYRKEK